MARASGVALLAAALLGAPTLSPHAFAQAQLPLSPSTLQRQLRALSVRRYPRLSNLMRLLTAPPAQQATQQPVTRLLIKLRPGVDHAAFAQRFSAAAHNALPFDAALLGNRPLLEHVRLHAGIGWSTFEVPVPEALQPMIDALRKNPDVLEVEPDYPILKLASPLPPPDDHYWGLLDWEHTFAVWGLGSTSLSDVQDIDSNSWNYSWSMEQVSALAAWSTYPGHYSTASERVNLLNTDPARLPIVGVIDTGVDMTHPDFSYTGNPGLTLYDPNNPSGYDFAANSHDIDVRNGGQIDIQFARSFVSATSDGYQGDDPALAMDNYGHGTGTSSIIAAAPNNAIFDTRLSPPAEDAVPGVTWDALNEPVYKSGLTGLGFPARIVPIKVIDANNGGSDSDVIDAIEYACADWTDPATGIVHPSPHCSILNMSLALDTTNYPKALQDAVDFAWNHGTLIIAAAGNDGATNPATPRYPARCDKVLAVSATTYDDPNGGVPEQITSYSDYGDQIGVAGPGGDLQQYSNNATGDFAIDPVEEYIAPFMLQPTYLAVLNDPNGTTQDSTYASLGFAGPYVGELPGTSFAAPHVVGLAALYASEHRITQSTPGGPQAIIDAIERGADSITGNAGYETTYGWGRINASATIQDHNNRGAAAGGFIGRVRYIDTVVGNITVIAQVAVGRGRIYSATSDPDGLYHLANLPASESGTVYNVTTTVFGVTAATQVTVLPGCDQFGVNLTPGAQSVKIKGLLLHPRTVAGSLQSIGTVNLTGPALSNTVVSLSSSSPKASVPNSVTVPIGASSQTFTITTLPVSAVTTVKITAIGNGTASNLLTVRPIGTLAVTLDSTTVQGGASVGGTVTLEGSATPGPITVTFTSSNPNIAPAPAGITVPAGTQSAAFTVTTLAHTTGRITIKATANKITKSSPPLTVTK